MSLGGVLRLLWKSRFRKGSSMLKSGDPAPDFEAIDDRGQPIRLSDFRGKNVVLWFFPKADTPG
jgi:peroxiredoxin